MAGVGGVVVVCCLAYWYYTTVPLPPDNVPVETTVIYASDGTTELAKLFDGENRTVVPLGSMPEVLIDAVVASEDHNFYQHGGLDPLGIGRALWSNVRSRGSLQGGSTITQQYVKNAYLNSARSLKRKLREGVIAIKIEQRFTKKEILEKYLNTIYFGRGAYGVQAAAQAYFHQDVGTLTLSEAAYMAGLIRSPETADATRDIVTAEARRRRVLTAMVTYKKITADESSAAQVVSLAEVVVPRAGPASTYSAVAVELHAEAYVNVLRSQLIDEFGARQTYGGGLRVVSTLDAAKQRAAWRSVAKTLNRVDDPEAALVALDDRGQVVAMIGGRSAYAVSQVNRAVRGAGSLGRQAGSTFKPVVLAAVLDGGFTVESAFRGPAELTVASVNLNGVPWKPKNFDKESFGTINLIDATRLSVNTVFAQIVTATDITPERVVAMAQKLGIGKRDKDGTVLALRAFPTIALGAQETSPIEMADAYLTFARRGERVDPRFLVRVTDGRGAVRYAAPERVVGDRVLTKQQADVMNYVLQQVVLRGTGVGARITRPLAGKTGTTNDNRDAWFVGYTAGRCCSIAVWMGYDDNHEMRRAPR